MNHEQPSRKANEDRLRFPRPFSRLIAKAVNELWRPPQFFAHDHTDSTEFVFRLPFSVPVDLKRRDPAAYYRLFLTGSKGWSQLLAKAYESSEHDGRPVKKEVESLLQKVLVQALHILLDEHKDFFHQDDAQVLTEQRTLRQSVIRSGRRADPQGRERTAIRLADRYRKLLPHVKKIRAFVKKNEGLLGDSEIKGEIERKFPYDWVPLITRGPALQNLLPIPAHEPRVETLSGGGWTPRQLTVGIIVCEERMRLGAGTIYEKYITLGNRLIEK